MKRWAEAIEAVESTGTSYITRRSQLVIARSYATDNWRCNGQFSERERVHDPTNGEGNCQEGQEDKHAVTELFARLVLRNQREYRRDNQCKDDQSDKVGKNHG